MIDTIYVSFPSIEFCVSLQGAINLVTLTQSRAHLARLAHQRDALHDSPPPATEIDPSDIPSSSAPPIPLSTNIPSSSSVAPLDPPIARTLSTILDRVGTIMD